MMGTICIPNKILLIRCSPGYRRSRRALGFGMGMSLGCRIEGFGAIAQNLKSEPEP